jgi:hypothetical protein
MPFGCGLQISHNTSVHPGKRNRHIRLVQMKCIWSLFWAENFRTLELVLKDVEEFNWCTSWWPISSQNSLGYCWKHGMIVALKSFVRIRSSLPFSLGCQVWTVWRMVQHVSDSSGDMWLGVVLHEVTSSDCAGPVSVDVTRFHYNAVLWW